MNIFNVILLTIMLEFKTVTHEILETQKTIYETHCSPKNNCFTLLIVSQVFQVTKQNQTQYLKSPKYNKKKKTFNVILFFCGRWV